MVKYNVKICCYIIKYLTTSAYHYLFLIDSGEKSSFLPALRFFLTELALHDVKAAKACFEAADSTWSHFSPSEKELYNYSKCTIIVRLLEFSTMVLLKCQPDVWKV